jgi:hypothetical protein
MLLMSKIDTPSCPKAGHFRVSLLRGNATCHAGGQPAWAEHTYHRIVYLFETPLNIADFFEINRDEDRVRELGEGSFLCA